MRTKLGKLRREQMPIAAVLIAMTLLLGTAWHDARPLPTGATPAAEEKANAPTKRIALHKPRVATDSASAVLLQGVDAATMKERARIPRSVAERVVEYVQAEQPTHWAKIRQVNGIGPKRLAALQHAFGNADALHKGERNDTANNRP